MGIGRHVHQVYTSGCTTRVYLRVYNTGIPQGVQQVYIRGVQQVYIRGVQQWCMCRVCNSGVCAGCTTVGMCGVYNGGYVQGVYNGGYEAHRASL